MSQISLAVGVFVLATGLWQQPPAAAPPTGQLRFVRGLVAQTSPVGVTLQLRDKTLTVSLDRDARTIPVGSLVEVHYLEKPAPRAVLILEGLPPDTEVSKRPGRSYRGVISRVKSSDVSITVDTRRRGVKMDKRTKLIGADGLSLAVGSKAVSGQLQVGDLVLVNYDEQPDDLYAGDIYLPGTQQRALEIRKLGN